MSLTSSEAKAADNKVCRACARLRACVHVSVYVCACVRASVCVRVLMHIHARARARTHTHTVLLPCMLSGLLVVKTAKVVRAGGCGGAYCV